MLETNVMIDPQSELQQKGQALINAAHEFWLARQKLSGPGAVVWLKDTSGHFVLFTRGEYLNEIMSRVMPLADETPLIDPFESKITDELVAAAVYAEAWFTHQECVAPDSLDYRAFQAADRLRGPLGKIEGDRDYQPIMDKAMAEFQEIKIDDQTSI